MATAPTKADEPELPVKTFGEKEPRLDIKKGTKVRLLQPFWDGVQYFNADEIIKWPVDTPPTTAQATYANQKAEAINAPLFPPADPPADYIDPRTGEKFEKPEA